ncbi:hypothetical protein [Arthrobacter sp. Y-9]|uniref:hypothetical protein n=1 Tax=Arthrobacter sp. Y-9 TaxID=3039385 RepID=UPI00241C6977|nr:hypothetical protein [Arthrobacter sp. Y-9]WFR85509.1 hypothetical protein P9849_07825 [Arthrobacter sp. Y-9]
MTEDRKITPDTSFEISYVALFCVLAMIAGSLFAVHALWPASFADVAVWVVVGEVIVLLTAVFIHQARRRRVVKDAGLDATGVVESSEPWRRQGQEGAEDTVGSVVTVVFTDRDGRVRRTTQSVEDILPVGRRIALRYLPDRAGRQDGVLLLSTLVEE